MDVRVLVGLNVQRLRRERDISQEDLSLRSGCTRGYLSGIETGRRNPTVVFLAGLAKVLGSDIAEFFERPAGSKAGNKSVTAQRKTKHASRM
ncbi:helix-turn-helix domain-containing protein [Stappia sp. MMSF_3263]|uniref:helix-turn-helix domain-containing protein n=1 Tax=Stappia sp. MMSF_3263 TaxID=3046693 RepID=UPI00273E3E7E|nr:helix-turn-helix transcriptional regulator [Stappia sp. MMSF_3263]